MNIKRFNGNDFPGDKWVRDILSRVNEIVDYLKLQSRTPAAQEATEVELDDLADEVTEVLAPLTSVGTDGQVLTSDGTTAGWETLPSASSSAPGLLSRYVEGTWTPSMVSKVNMGGTGTFGTAKYTRIGRMVFANIASITGYTVTTAASQVELQIATTGLPSIANATSFYGATGTIQVQTSPNEMIPVHGLDASGGSTSVYFIGEGGVQGVANSDSITWYALSFWYYTDE